MNVFDKMNDLNDDFVLLLKLGKLYLIKIHRFVLACIVVVII